MQNMGIFLLYSWLIFVQSTLGEADEVASAGLQENRMYTRMFSAGADIQKDRMLSESIEIGKVKGYKEPKQHVLDSIFGAGNVEDGAERVIPQGRSLSKIKNVDCISGKYPWVYIKEGTIVSLAGPKEQSQSFAPAKCGWKLSVNIGKRIRILCPRFELSEDSLVGFKDLRNKQELVFYHDKPMGNVTSFGERVFIGFHGSAVDPTADFQCFAFSVEGRKAVATSQVTATSETVPSGTITRTVSSGSSQDTTGTLSLLTNELNGVRKPFVLTRFGDSSSSELSRRSYENTIEARRAAAKVESSLHWLLKLKPTEINQPSSLKTSPHYAKFDKS